MALATFMKAKYGCYLIFLEAVFIVVVGFFKRLKEQVRVSEYHLAAQEICFISNDPIASPL